MERTKMVCVGVVTGAHGVKGEARITSFTGSAEAISAYGPLFDESGRRRFRLQVTGRSRAGVIARIKGIGDRNAAEALKGEKLYIPRGRLPETGDEEYYHRDLIGLAAELIEPSGQSCDRLGTVAAVHDFGAGPLLEITRGDKPSVLVPFTREVVPEVDIAGGQLTVVRLPGLLNGGGEKGGER